MMKWLALIWMLIGDRFGLNTEPLEFTTARRDADSKLVTFDSLTLEPVEIMTQVYGDTSVGTVNLLANGTMTYGNWGCGGLVGTEAELLALLGTIQTLEQPSRISVICSSTLGTWLERREAAHSEIAGIMLERVAHRLRTGRHELRIARLEVAHPLDAQHSLSASERRLH